MSNTILTTVTLEDDEVLEQTKKKKKRIPIRFRKIGENIMDSFKILTEMTPQESRAVIKLRNNHCVSDNTTFISTSDMNPYQIKEQRKGINRLKKKNIIKEISRNEFVFNYEFMVPNGDVFHELKKEYDSL